MYHMFLLLHFLQYLCINCLSTHMFDIVELDFSCNVTSDWITHRSKMIIITENYV